MTSTAETPATDQTKGQYDVAIVGGGIAGLYAAYRLREVWKSAGDKALGGVRTCLKLEAIQTLRVVILEENPLELGGRVRAVKLPFPGGAVTAEVGPMRFTTRQRLLRRLLHDLDIKTMPFHGEGFDTSYFLRGKHFRDDDVKSGQSPYHLPSTSDHPEHNKTVEQLVKMVFDTTLDELTIDSDSYDIAPPQPGDTEEERANKARDLNECYLPTLRALEKLRNKELQATLTHKEWLEIQEHCLVRGTIRLRDIGLWNLLHHYLSPDGAKLVEDGFGYESVLGNWNLSDAIPWFIDDFSPGQSYEAVEKGFSHFVERLRTDLVDEPDVKTKARKHPTFRCEILFNTRARRIGFDAGADRYLLRATTTAKRYNHSNDSEREPFATALAEEEDPLQKWWNPDLQWWGFSVRDVILAIPKEPLSKLNVDDLLAGSADGKQPHSGRVREWRANLDTVRAHRLAKLVQAFRKPWWRSPESRKGAGQLIITDLPLRQVYYWDQEWLEKRDRYEFYDANGKVRERTLEERTLGESPDIGGIIVAYLDGHYVSYWRFITTVQRLRAHEELYREDEADSSLKAEAAEGRRQKCFGPRVWWWGEPPIRWDDGTRKSVTRMEDFYEHFVEDWTAEERVRYLYLRKHGLFKRASDKMARILKDLHASLKDGQTGAPDDPVVGAYMFWDNFGDEPIPEAGWHTWEPGANSEKTMKKMSRPFPPDKLGHASAEKKLGEEKHRVFVCGEAYSSEQGWIEGALKSVERLIHEFGVKLPGDVCEHVGLCEKDHDHPKPWPEEAIAQKKREEANEHREREILREAESKEERT